MKKLILMTMLFTVSAPILASSDLGETSEAVVTRGCAITTCSIDRDTESDAIPQLSTAPRSEAAVRGK